MKKTGLLVCKIGGSLLTNKLALKCPDHHYIARAGNVLASLEDAVKQRLILIAGGGSYGNAGAFSPDRNGDLTRVSAFMDEWSMLLFREWENKALPLAPFTIADLFTENEQGKNRISLVKVERALKAGKIPLLFGGVIKNKSRQRLVSSDLVPLFFGRRFLINRVVSLTDVEGLYCNGSVLKTIDKNNVSEAILASKGSGKPDMTGGMRTKLLALLKLASRGVEGVICSGKNPESIGHSLTSPAPIGTLISKWL